MERSAIFQISISTVQLADVPAPCMLFKIWGRPNINSSSQSLCHNNYYFCHMLWFPGNSHVCSDDIWYIIYIYFYYILYIYLMCVPIMFIYRLYGCVQHIYIYAAHRHIMEAVQGFLVVLWTMCCSSPQGGKGERGEHGRPGERVSASILVFLLALYIHWPMY